MAETTKFKTKNFLKYYNKYWVVTCVVVLVLHYLFVVVVLFSCVASVL